MHKAFEYLRKSEEVDKPDTRYEVTARRTDSSTSQRGVVLRDPLESAKAVTFMCEVQPKLHEVCCHSVKLFNHLSQPVQYLWSNLGSNDQCIHTT